MANRGELTKEVQEIAQERLGRDITLQELRLIPYVQFVMVNEQVVSRHKMTPDGYVILDKWEKEKLISLNGPCVEISKLFWDFVCEVLYWAYVKYEYYPLK